MADLLDDGGGGSPSTTCEEVSDHESVLALNGDLSEASSLLLPGVGDSCPPNGERGLRLENESMLARRGMSGSSIGFRRACLPDPGAVRGLEEEVEMVAPSNGLDVAGRFGDPLNGPRTSPARLEGRLLVPSASRRKRSRSLSALVKVIRPSVRLLTWSSLERRSETMLFSNWTSTVAGDRVRSSSCSSI